jgi:hypothetical protein
MHAKSVALIPVAQNARRTGYRRTRNRRSACLTDDEPPELVFYCPE